jgi:hypothetical protein
VPYDKTKCDELEGKKSSYVRIPNRRGTKFEYKMCPKTYPAPPTPTPDDNDTKPNPTPIPSPTDNYGAGVVPSPARPSL